jgi:hypothetical protein
VEKNTRKSTYLQVIAFFIILLAMLVTARISLASIPASIPAAVPAGAAAPPAQSAHNGKALTGKPQANTTGSTALTHLLNQPAFPNVTLYDQYNNAASTSTVSQDFETANDGFDSQAADDFVVPSGQTWQVNEIDVGAVYFNGTGPAVSMNVFFYLNSGTLPATPVYTATGLAYTSTTGNFVIPLPTAANLSGGGGGTTYWVSVQARMDYATGGEFGWTDRTVQSNSPSAFRNPGGGFACPGGNGWIIKTVCVPTGSVDNEFRLLGNISGGATPTRTSTGAVPTSTRTRTSTPTSTAVGATPTPTACSIANYSYSVNTGATIVPGTTDTGNHTDDGSTVLSLPFSYQLYDQTFTQVEVGSNGHLTFGSVNNAFNPSCIPIGTATYAVFPYETDQCTGPCTGVVCAVCGIFTSISGTAPNRIFNIEYRTAYYNSGGDGIHLNYEVRLYEGQTAFDVIYGTIPTFSPPAQRNLTVGAQKGPADLFTSVGCDTTGGTAPPVSAGQLYHYFLSACGTATNTPAPATATNTPTSTPTDTPTNISTQAPGTPTNTPTFTPTTEPAGTDTATPAVTVTPCTISFSDVPVGSTFYDYIRCLACRGIINGYSDGTFRPNNNVTRGQLSKIISNSAGFNDPQTTQMFDDVPVGSPFFDFIGRLASRGYIGGYLCGSPGEPCHAGNLPYFRPNTTATRGQFTNIDSNAAGFNDAPSGQQFEDVAVGSTYYTYTYRLVSRSIMSGYPCGGVGEPCQPGSLPYFRPNNNATRGQTSKIVANTYFPNCQTPSDIKR